VRILARFAGSCRPKARPKPKPKAAGKKKRYGRWGVRWVCPLGGRVGARVGGARCARGRVGWDEMEGEGGGMGGWEIGEGVGWEDEQIRWGSGILGRFGHADRRALIDLKSLYRHR
jgi:hypothetical protein